MRVLYFIGNGFDLNLGLKTSYQDFYGYYKSIKSNDKIICKFKDELKETNINWSDLESIIGKYAWQFNIKSVGEFLGLLMDIRKSLTAYLLGQDNLKVNKLAIGKFFNDLITPQQYLQKREKNDYDAYIERLDLTFQHINIINFNYTTIVDRLLDNAKEINLESGILQDYRIGSLIHIHGTLKSGMILGVNDSTQINNGILRNENKMIKGVIKPNLCSARDVNICKSFIVNADVIILFGVSLGKTDKVWWEAIIEHLKKHDSRLIIFSYAQSRVEVINKILSFGRNKNVNELKDKIYVSVKSDMFYLR